MTKITEMAEFFDKDGDMLRVYSEGTGTVSMEATVYSDDPEETVVNTIFVERKDALDLARAVLSKAEIKADIIPHSESSVQENPDGSLDCEGLITEGSPTPETMRNVAAKALKIAKALEDRQKRDRLEAMRILMPDVHEQYLKFEHLSEMSRLAVDEIVRLRYELKKALAVDTKV